MRGRPFAPVLLVAASSALVAAAAATRFLCAVSILATISWADVVVPRSAPEPANAPATTGTTVPAADVADAPAAATAEAAAAAAWVRSITSA